MYDADDTLIYQGGPVKVLDRTGGEVKVGGPLVVFGGSDLEGEFFTAETYFGAQMKARGEAVLDTMFNHGLAMHASYKALAMHEFLPLEAKQTDTGIMAEILLRERDEYEAMVAQMAEAGKLGLSSGSAPHAVRKGAGGEIKRWPLVEGSLTHMPAEPRTSATPLKTLVGEAEAADYRGELLSSLRETRARVAQHDLASSLRSITRTIRA